MMFKIGLAFIATNLFTQIKVEQLCDKIFW
jgi:hypothetical protein